MTCHQSTTSDNWILVVVGFEPTSLQDTCTCKDVLEYKQVQSGVGEKWFQAKECKEDIPPPAQT